MEERTGLKGILGGLVGGIIGSLPWILCFVFTNYMLSVFALLIPLAAAKGYKIAKGQIYMKSTWILVGLTLVVVSLVMFAIIPLILFAKEGYSVSFGSLGFLLFETDYVKTSIVDLLFAYIFSIASAIAYGLHAVNLAKKANQEDVRFTISAKELFNDSESVKEYCILQNALAPGFEISKDDMTQFDQRTISYLISNNVIKASNNGYYFDLDSYEKLSTSQYKQKGFTKKALKIFLIIFGVVVLSTALLFLIIGNKKTVTFKDFTFEIPNNYTSEVNEIFQDMMFVYLSGDISFDNGYASIFEFPTICNAQEDKEQWDAYFQERDGIQTFDSQLLVNKNNIDYLRYIMTDIDGNYYQYYYVYDKGLVLAINICSPVDNTKICEDLKIIVETIKR